MRLQFNTRFIDGYIQHSKCTECNCNLSNLILQGDTDMATMGLVSLAKPDEKTVLLTEATNEEWMGYKTDLIAQRVSKESGTIGFAVIEHENFVDNKGYKEWLPKCPKCGSKHELTNKMNLPDFIDNKGNIRVLDNFENQNLVEILTFLQELADLGGITTLKDEYENPMTDRVILHCLQNNYVKRSSKHPLDFKDIKLTELGLNKIKNA